MQYQKSLFVLLLPFLLLACDNDNNNNNNEAPLLELTAAEAPVGLAVDNVQFIGDVYYGEEGLEGYCLEPNEEDCNANSFDIFLPDADQPTALIIYIHGGGFTGGDKSADYSWSMDYVNEALSRGMAYATINYRLLEEMDSEGVYKPMNDSKRCLQFIRYYAKSFNIDPDQIAIYGASAGAGTAMWLAFHDEMAGADGGDMIDQQSTRIRAVGAIETQSTYDLVRWEQDVLQEVGVTLQIAVTLGLEQRLLSFYGLTPQTPAEVDAAVDAIFNDPEIAAYRADVDILALMTADDPSLWVNNFRITYAPGTNDLVDWIFHHPLHAEALYEQAQFIGIEAVAYYPLNIRPFEDPSAEQLISFLARHLEL